MQYLLLCFSLIVFSKSIESTNGCTGDLVFEPEKAPASSVQPCSSSRLPPEQDLIVYDGFLRTFKPSPINFSSTISPNHKITSFSSLEKEDFNQTIAQCPEKIPVPAPATLLIQATLPWRRRHDFSEYVDGYSQLEKR